MSTILVAVILVSVIALIVFILVAINSRERKKSTLELLSQFSGVATQKNLTFTSQEILETVLMGLDGIQRKLLIISRLGADKHDTLLIDLKEVKTCTKKQLYNRISVGNYSKARFENQIQKIVLEFEYTDGRVPSQITFFEPTTSHMLDMSELDQKAKKWEGIISKLLPYDIKRTG